MAVVRKRFPGAYVFISRPFTPVSAAASAPAPPPPVLDSFVTISSEVIDLLGYGSFSPMGITAITFTSVSSIAGFLFFNDTNIVSLSFPNLVSIDPGNTQSGTFMISGCSHLTTIDVPVFVPTPSIAYSFTGCALSAATVNEFLARCVASGAFTSGSIDMSGGTSSAPTGQGLTDKATLIGRGVTVMTN